MKTSFISLLVLPAVLAVPTPELVKAGKQVTACACANELGETQAGGWCQYIAGGLVTLDGQQFCFPAATWSEYMETQFTADFCPEYFRGYPKPVCKTVTVCKTLGDYQDIC